MAETDEIKNTDAKTGSARPGSPPQLPHIDISEKGRDADGSATSLNRRLFMQFMALEGEGGIEELVALSQKENPQWVLYQDFNDPRGAGVLVFCEDPAYVSEVIHPLLNSSVGKNWKVRPEFTMVGRTYSIGYESDLEEVLINRPVTKICDPELPWSVWYPVRRSGLFERQSREEQRKMLLEHGGIGHAYGKAGYATDIRLAGHGLNKDDNDFIVGLLGKELFPLSALVQHMRRTRQTSEFIERMGPFFVGKTVWQPQPELGR